MNKSKSESELLRGFGQLPNQIALRTYQQQLGPLLSGLGISGGGRRIAEGKGPLAGLIRYIQQAAPEIMGQTSGLSAEANQAIANLPNYQEMLTQGGQAAQDTLAAAQQYQQEVMSPIQSQALYQQTLADSLQGAQQGAAARGLLDSGAAQQNESRMARDIGMGFAQNRRSDQQGAINLMGQMPGLLQNAASGQLQGIANQYNTRAGFQQMPLQLASNLQSLYGAGTQGANTLTAATAPVVGQNSKGFGIL